MTHMALGLIVMLAITVWDTPYYTTYQIQNKHLDATHYFFMRGCLVGTEHDDTYKPKGFNTNSPRFYCSRAMRDREDRFIKSMVEVVEKE